MSELGIRERDSVWGVDPMMFPLVLRGTGNEDLSDAHLYSL